MFFFFRILSGKVTQLFQSDNDLKTNEARSFLSCQRKKRISFTSNCVFMTVHTYKHALPLYFNLCERLCTLGCLSAPSGQTCRPLARLLPAFKNAKCLHLKAFILGWHISHLSLQRERGGVRVSSGCRRCRRSEKKCHPKYRTLCHACKD